MAATDHTFVHPANPYLACEECGLRVRAIHDATACGCDDRSYNKRCGHTGVVSECPTWGAEGPKCICQQEGVTHG